VLSPREVIAYCRGHLEDFMVPKYVNMVAALPKSPNGKVDRRALAAAK
jgi:acyl-CoA synthetase (AMP-forming)/AMP-acid ligase II